MTKLPLISMIAAIGTHTGVLGKNGELVWRIPDDMKRFKALTVGHVVVMGRKTWESIPERFRPLPGRTNIIITRDESYEAPGALVVHSVSEALEKARETEKEEIFIIGGAQIYADALPRTDRLYLTLVDSEAPGDAFFPDYSEFKKEVSHEEHSEADPPYIFAVLEK